MKKKSTSRAKTNVRREIDALRHTPDAEVDFSEIPRQNASDPKWKNAVVGRLYRPIKMPVALRLDADVLAWLKKQGPGYQSRINQILRREMLESHK